MQYPTPQTLVDAVNMYFEITNPVREQACFPAKSELIFTQLVAARRRKGPVFCEAHTRHDQRGGIYDHLLAEGFPLLSMKNPTTAFFKKMLYDNAILAEVSFKPGNILKIPNMPRSLRKSSIT